jgi:PEP-CTERM motif
MFCIFNGYAVGLELQQHCQFFVRGRVSGGPVKRAALAFLLMAVCLVLPAVSYADSVQVGAISFNHLLPGVNDFQVDNFTGTNNLGGLLSPVADNLILQSISLTVTCANAACVTDIGGNTGTFLIPDLGPGSDTSVTFNAADAFSQALLAANFSHTQLNLVSGGTFAGSPSMSLTLAGSNGSFLQAGVDSGTLVDVTPVPEPTSLALMAVGLAGMFGLRRAKRQC